MAHDDRTYVRLHDGFDEHPKVTGLSDKAFRTYIEALCYCSRNLTDGKVSFATSRKLASSRVWAVLLAAGLVEEVNADGISYVLHDYLEHQRSADQVKQFKAAKQEAGRRGGKARAAALADAKQVLKQTSKQTGGEMYPETETETDISTKRGAGAPHAPKRATPTPATFTVDEALREWATSKGLRVNLDRETEKFLDWHRAKGSTFKDWRAAWRTWMTRAGETVTNGHGNGRAIRSGAPNWQHTFADGTPMPWDR
jgi:hypothetical protein